MHAGCRPELVSCSHKPPFVPNSQTPESSCWLRGTGCLRRFGLLRLTECLLPLTSSPAFHRQEEAVLPACCPFPPWGGLSRGRLPGGFLNSASSVPTQAISISKAINTQEAPVKEKHARRILPCPPWALRPAGSVKGRTWARLVQSLPVAWVGGSSLVPQMTTKAL